MPQGKMKVKTKLPVNAAKVQAKKKAAKGPRVPKRNSKFLIKDIFFIYYLMVYRQKQLTELTHFITQTS